MGTDETAHDDARVVELTRLLDEERTLSEFRRERWENAEARIEHIWNKAIEAAREKLGQHTPPCDPALATPCWLCWQNQKLTSLLRLDRAGYMTVRERIRIVHDKVIQEDSSPEVQAGMNMMADAVSQLFGEKE